VSWFHALQRHRSGWTSTLIACIEMAKHGDLVLAQDDSFAPIQVSTSMAGLPADSQSSSPAFA